MQHVVVHREHRAHAQRKQERAAPRMMEEADPFADGPAAGVRELDHGPVLQLRRKRHDGEVQRLVRHEEPLRIQPDRRHPPEAAVLVALVVELQRALAGRLDVRQDVIAREHQPRRDEKPGPEGIASHGHPADGGGEPGGALHEPWLQPILRRPKDLFENGHPDSP